MADDGEDRVVPFEPARSALEDAIEVKPEPPERDDGRGGGRGRSPRPRRDGLPDDCPVLALGHDSGTFYYLNPAGQLRDLAASRHTKNDLQGLFAGRMEYLRDHWPRYAKGLDSAGKPICNGIQYDLASMALMQACAVAGIWSPNDNLRGPGNWLGPDGELVIHCGDAVLIVGTDGREVWTRPGAHDVYVYTAATRCPRPVSGRVGTSEIRELLTLLRCWAWSRPEIDPVLMLGWLGCGVLGAALDWRPTVWITGGSGTGKSSLKDRLVEPLLGRDGVVALTDTSEAGLRQKLRQMSLPAIVDELEPEADGRKIQGIIRLARLASSGGKLSRGGQDHHEVVFQLRSAMAFQSIVIPPLNPQDRNRVAILELEALGDRRMPAINPRRMEEIGACLRRRLIQAWPRLAQTLERYHETMRAAGPEAMDARGAALYGSLMAVAEVLLFEDPEEMDADFRRMPEALQAQVSEEREGMDEGARFLAHLLSCTIEVSRGSQPLTVADLIRNAAGADADDAHRAKRALGRHGIYVGPYTKEMADVIGVAIANVSDGMAKLLAGSHWTAAPGQSAPWVQVTRRLALAHGGQPKPRRTWRFAGYASRGAWVPLKVFLAEGEGDG